MRSFVAIVLLLNLTFNIQAQPEEFRFIKSLLPEWETFNNGRLERFSENADRPVVVYFKIDQTRYHQAYLEVMSLSDFSLFVNRKLLVTEGQGRQRLSLDSLANLFSSSLHFAVYTPDGIAELETNIVGRQTVVESSGLDMREESAFYDFSILATIILLAYFVVLFKNHPKLTLDYLNVLGLFSLQEREDNLLSSRITSSVNLLFYGFISLFFGLVIHVAYHFSIQEGINPYGFLPVPETFLNVLVQWLTISFGILLMLLLKLIIIHSSSTLFGMTEATSFHFFNYVRLFFFLAILAAVLEIVYFIIGVNDLALYNTILIGMAITSSLWILLIYFKLLVRVPIPFFHLFSYLCPSEIIPIVIILKVLFF